MKVIAGAGRGDFACVQCDRPQANYAGIMVMGEAYVCWNCILDEAIGHRECRHGEGQCLEPEPFDLD